MRKCQKNVKEVSTIVKSREIVCYLQLIMNDTRTYRFKILVILICCIALGSCSDDHDDVASEHIKIALRDVGHHLLLNNQDSTSLVQPVLALKDFKYQLSFEVELAIHPDSLVKEIKQSFQKSNLPQFYLVEVLQCEDHEVAYSYEMKQNVEKGIIPCGGRQLKKGCYLITVRLTKIQDIEKNNSYLFSILLGIAVLFMVAFLMYKRQPKYKTQDNDGNFSKIGRYKFYPEQNKLIREATEISLSKKECELLELFVAQPNQIIKRDELTKKVWEDNGVVVGRSLDTYISKLRKKLQDDDTIKLTNVHGVGYKLELK